jgi:cellulose synthase/poly-beta-1,6-N-acetylglucosamine synthase-like glycosyltransferase
MVHTFEFLLLIVLYGSLAVIVYSYLGYPVILSLWASLKGRPVLKSTKQVVPSVTVVIAAWNEEPRIQARVRNLLDQDYPHSNLDVLVVSDGSTDGTASAILSMGSDRVTVLSLEERKGKAVAINHGVAAARGEIIVFADARQRFSSTTVRELVGNFADPCVGAVTGELILEDIGQRAGRSHAAGMYWKIEKWIRRNEGAIDSVAGVTGAVYAIRRRLYPVLPPNTVLDDLLVPMRIAMNGYRVVFEPSALAFDSVAGDYRVEFARKVRTLAGNYQAMSLCPGLLFPWRNRLFFQFWSHKVTRLMAPFCLVLLLFTNLLVRHGWLDMLLMLQLVSYAVAGTGWGLRIFGVRESWTSPAFTFCLFNYAALVGAFKFFSSRPIVWSRTS